MPRTRTRLPPGLSVSSSPICTLPLVTLPVATVPTPGSVKERSTARRKAGAVAVDARAPSWACACASKCWRSASTPSPVMADTSNIGAPASAVGESNSLTSARTCASRSARVAASSRSTLVMATLALGTPSSESTAKCSRVCGMTPSSAATMSSACAMPVAPASMVCSSFSWPGTSTKPSDTPSGVCR